ncbi:Secreted lipase [Colletotrichum fructicola]|nr:Secreted lipase [Colletotrichum fructicola]
MRYSSFIVLQAALATSASALTCNPLQLDWGTWKAAPESTDSLCVYKDVRFASSPTGDLRFAAPEYPPDAKSGKSSVDSPVCVAMTETKCVKNPSKSDSCFPHTFGNPTEDCLFLDIYVPKEATLSQQKVPVIVWFYGGAFVFGSKTQYQKPGKLNFYGGNGIVSPSVSDSPVIFVVPNYRLGAFGWLSGTYMEEHAQPNAGLLDQRAALQFVQDSIGQLNGDKTQVSVWGESAGASSILHHMVVPQESYPPLFQKALLQSPAYQFLWDRKGVLNDTFTRFAEAVAAKTPNCQAANIDCLRSADFAVLTKVNQDLFNEVACEGIFPVGPAVDNKLILDIPTNLFQDAKNVIPLDSVLVSHVDQEIPKSSSSAGFSFIPLPIRQHPTDPSKFDDFLDEFLSGDSYAGIRSSIQAQYPSANYDDQVDRARHVIMDSSFLCNTRVVIDGYLSQKKQVWAFDYVFLQKYGRANHASDLVPTFSSSDINYFDLFDCLIKVWAIKGLIAKIISSFVSNTLGPGMISYFVSFSVTGNPNKTPHSQTTWQPAQIIDGKVNNVIQARGELNPFSPIIDEQNTDQICGFWKQVAADITTAYDNSGVSDIEIAPKMEEQATFEEL